MRHLTLPVIIDEQGDIELVADLQKAALSMEAADVLNREYEVFDSVGHRIQLLVEESSEKVVLALDATCQADPEELRRRLIRYIARLGSGRVPIRGSVNEAALADLVKALSAFFFDRG